jgi:hypothetical protein
MVKPTYVAVPHCDNSMLSMPLWQDLNNYIIIPITCQKMWLGRSQKNEQHVAVSKHLDLDEQLQYMHLLSCHVGH